MLPILHSQICVTIHSRSVLELWQTDDTMSGEGRCPGGSLQRERRLQGCSHCAVHTPSHGSSACPSALCTPLCMPFNAFNASNTLSVCMVHTFRSSLYGASCHLPLHIGGCSSGLRQDILKALPILYADSDGMVGWDEVALLSLSASPPSTPSEIVQASAG